MDADCRVRDRNKQQTLLRMMHGVCRIFAGYWRTGQEAWIRSLAAVGISFRLDSSILMCVCVGGTEIDGRTYGTYHTHRPAARRKAIARSILIPGIVVNLSSKRDSEIGNESKRRMQQSRVVLCGGLECHMSMREHDLPTICRLLLRSSAHTKTYTAPSSYSSSWQRCFPCTHAYKDDCIKMSCSCAGLSTSIHHGLDTERARKPRGTAFPDRPAACNRTQQFLPFFSNAAD
jgi:hypothetical protein